MEETTSPSGVGEPPSHSSCDKPNFSLVLLVLVLGPGDGDNFVPLTVLVPTLSALRLTPHEPAKLNACTSQFHVIAGVTLSVTWAVSSFLPCDQLQFGYFSFYNKSGNTLSVCVCPSVRPSVCI